MSEAPSFVPDAGQGRAEPPTLVPRSALASMGERQSQLLRIAVVVSVVAHVGIFGAWVVWPSSKKPSVELDEAVIKTRLVKLGKPRDEKLLPRLPTSPPPPPPTESTPQPVVEPPKTPDSRPEPAPETKRSAADILHALKQQADTPKNLKDVIKDRIGEPTDEGRTDGDVDGRAIDGEVTASYFARVQARIQDAMKVSSVLTDDELVRLRAVLCLKIDEQGVVSDVTVKTSGSQIYDADVVAAARRASPVPAPPLPARKQAGQGVCFNACPKSCR
jgi:TonB family protein